ncbi:MAG: hypothetical protein OQJ81_10555 [Melioribacteraceae bacterium]|nr:hypothetical protein [Melioribacteraceae bacterium]
MKIKSFFLILILIGSNFWISCSDEPNDVGSVLLPDNDKLKTKIFSSLTENVAQSFVSFQEDSLYWGSSNRLLLGNYENIKSEILISFQMLLPDSIKTALETENSVQLVSSWIELYPNYWIGDSSNYSFTAHRINTHWNSVVINEDSINNVRLNLGPDLIQNFEYTAGDTSIKFSIGNEIVQDWIDNSLASTTQADYGIMLSPTSFGGIAGFQALTSFPSTQYPTLNLVFEKTNEFIDTVLIFPRIDIHVITGDRLIDPPNAIYLQGSISARGRLYFNLETLPENILVNSAKLDLFVDDLNTFEGTVKSDTVAASFYYNFEMDSIKYEFGKYPLLKNGDKYSGEIRQFVQRWLEGEANEGLELKLSDENRSPAAVSFFSSDHPDPLLRPRLTIYYTN